jgi:hypothetical protein
MMLQASLWQWSGFGWIYQNQIHAQIHQPRSAPSTKVSMGMDVAPNPNPLDIRISMDIHAHKNI